MWSVRCRKVYWRREYCKPQKFGNHGNVIVSFFSTTLLRSMKIWLWAEYVWMQIFHMIYYCLMISLGSGISSNSYKVSHEWLDVLFNREQQNTQQKERSYPKNYNNCYTMTTNIMNQFRYINIQPTSIDLSIRLWEITTEFVGFIPQSFMLRSTVLGWIFYISKLVHYKFTAAVTRPSLLGFSQSKYTSIG